MDNFVVFILSNRRADRVVTYKTLRNSGYTGRIVIVLDNEDDTVDQYIENFGEETLYIFDKKKVAEYTDVGDCVPNRDNVVYARNACFEIAEELGYEYFFVLDDDYGSFQNRFLSNGQYYTRGCTVRSLDKILELVLDYYKSIPNLASIAFAQGGDFIGGKGNSYAQVIKLRRKCMNSFICSTKRPFKFIGRINEDVNTYAHLGSKGELFLTLNQMVIGQGVTQSNAGGLSEYYIEHGTYMKSFYTVMYQPSSVIVQSMGIDHKRLHHRIDWNTTCPHIISEDYKKGGKKKKVKKGKK